MEKLTKELFWNDLYAQYPGEMKKFCDWIDEYKKRVEWNVLFNDGIREQAFIKTTKPKYTNAPKYHDLPIAMQIGIFLQYVAETDNYGGIEYPAIRGMASFATIPLYIQEFFEYENNINTHHAPVHAIRLQSDAAEAQDTHQANLEGTDGGGDEADEERGAPYDGGDASRSE